MKSQKQSVYDAIISVKGVLVKDLNAQEFDKVSEIVTNSILEGETGFDSRDKYNTPEKVYGYVRGMVKNWLRKGKELNGGVSYTPKYRKGQQKSETQKALEALLEKYPNNEEVKTALEECLKEKMKTKGEKTINVNALPEHLKKLVS